MIKEKLSGLLNRIVGVLDDFLSLKVQFCVAWMVFIVLSDFKTIVVIIGAIFGILALYIREIQKPDSNLTKILIAWFTKQNPLVGTRVPDNKKENEG